MFELNSIGKVLIILGIIFIIVGSIFTLGGKMPWLGRLPGDICIQRKNFTFFFPVTTSIIISIALSVIIMLLFKRR